jgi:hypothetical protein
MGGDYPSCAWLWLESFALNPAPKAPHQSNCKFESSYRSALGRALPDVRQQLEIMADGRGFEPRVPFGTHAFQACTIDRSVTHPCCSGGL